MRRIGLDVQSLAALALLAAMALVAIRFFSGLEDVPIEALEIHLLNDTPVIQIAGQRHRRELRRLERAALFDALTKLELYSYGKTSAERNCAEYLVPARKLGLSICAIGANSDFVYGYVWHGTESSRSDIRSVRSRELMAFVPER